MTLEEIKLKLQSALTPKRFEHSLNVMNTAVQLAQRFGADEKKAAVAGLLHDCARDIKGEYLMNLCQSYKIDADRISMAQPELLHGPLGSRLIAEEYGIFDEDIKRAVYFHTTGCENMSSLDKIIFIADYIEPGRDFPGVDEIRREVFTDMDKAVILALDSTIKFVISKGALIHTDTINARNYMIFEKQGYMKSKGRL